MDEAWNKEKYPTYLVGVLLLYLFVLGIALSSTPSSFYTFIDSIVLLIPLVLPALLFVLYLLGIFKSENAMKAIRVIIVILSFVAMLVGTLLAYVFF